MELIWFITESMLFTFQNRMSKKDLQQERLMGTHTQLAVDIQIRLEMFFGLEMAHF